MSEFTKEYYESKAETLIGNMYSQDNPNACKIFKRKLKYYEARIEYFEHIASMGYIIKEATSSQETEDE